MPAFSGGYAAGGAAIAVRKNILGQGQAESSLCLYAAGTGALLFGVSHRPRGRTVSLFAACLAASFAVRFVTQPAMRFAAPLAVRYGASMRTRLLCSLLYPPLHRLSKGTSRVVIAAERAGCFAFGYKCFYNLETENRPHWYADGFHSDITEDLSVVRTPKEG